MRKSLLTVVCAASRGEANDDSGRSGEGTAPRFRPDFGFRLPADRPKIDL
ncbi:hypothetical protein [Paenibacillus glycinis]|uniref:Uncharacterized protein n=1 Tax=Paenibacillus glycinis TaxID=2697035 RepID=A0ABW9XMR9_9BACL|nr:hypothetical protein [Paenibacillus glycinis]NBD23856.1 hypothetical protein [Paenibacillus glycinis]